MLAPTKFAAFETELRLASILDDLEPHGADHHPCDLLVVRSAPSCADRAHELAVLLDHQSSGERGEVEVAPLVERAATLFQVAGEGKRVPAHERGGVGLAHPVPQHAR